MRLSAPLDSTIACPESGHRSHNRIRVVHDTIDHKRSILTSTITACFHVPEQGTVLGLKGIEHAVATTYINYSIRESGSRKEIGALVCVPQFSTIPGSQCVHRFFEGIGGKTCTNSIENPTTHLRSKR